MSIPISGTTGYLFNRWGIELGAENEVQNLINGTLTARVAAINAQFASTDQNVLQVSSSNLANLQSTLQAAPQSYMSGVNNMLQNTLLQMALDAYPTLNPADLREALVLLIAQMNVGGYAAANSIQRPTITVSTTFPTGVGVAGGTNVGNGTMLLSLLDTDGRPLDYCLAETLTTTCTDDGYTGGGATAGSEPFSVVGQLPSASIYAYDYPQGSGANTPVTTLDTSLTTGTIVIDGNFELWTGSVPNSPWVTVVGAGTITKGVSPYTGTFNLVITGDGSTLTRIKQQVTLLPNTVYAFNVYAKTDGSVAAGSLRFSLVNYTTEAILNDNAATANTIIQAVSSLTSGYTSIHGFFRTPAVLPTSDQGVGVMLYLTTAITNTEVLQIDALGLQAATQVYPGGPWVAMFTGSTDFATGDVFTCVVANNSTITTFSRQLSRYFDLPGLGLKIPSANSPSISDGLIL